jgi:SsrA-binding protein
VGVNTAPYAPASYFNHDPMRPGKLLLHEREIERLREAVEEKGLTVVPLQVHLRRGWAKLEIAVVRGKKLHDRREDVKRRDEELDARREISRSRGPRP